MADPAIAPPPWKATWFINHPGTNSGWSETWYINIASLSGAHTSLSLIMDSRMSLLTNKYSMVYARLSSLNVKGDGYPTTHSLPIVGTFVPATPDGGKPGDAIILRASDGAGKRNMRVLRGIPEESILDGVVNTVAPFAALLISYFVILQGNAAFRRKTAIAPFVEFVPIAGISTGRAISKKVGRPFGLPRGRAAMS